MSITIEELITKYNLNQTDLANALSINQGTFSEKLRKKRHSKFTIEQQGKLKTYLHKHLNELAEDIKLLS